MTKETKRKTPLSERIEFLLQYGDALSDRIAVLEKKIESLESSRVGDRPFISYTPRG
jgi:hypothetical protein